MCLGDKNKCNREAGLTPQRGWPWPTTTWSVAVPTTSRELWLPSDL
ncbi:hypothetical protein LEMLEM_LOCUS26203, partial [Lemmus lemmus]